MQEITKKEVEKILRSKNLRQHLAYEYLMWFCLIYLRHWFKDPFAPFHLEMFHLLKSEYELVVVIAFRGAGKSTIMNTANVLWSILGKPQKQFAVIVSQTQDQAKNHFLNIKEELLRNQLLRQDFGPFTDDEGEWKKMSLELVYRESKILSVSREQGVRGIKYNSIRPDLIICDDMEDSSARFDKQKQEELYTRFASEIIPLGSKNTKIVVLGNLTCQDSFILRLNEDIDNGQQAGIFRIYPIIDQNRKILWEEKFKSLEEIKEDVWKRVPRDVWAREYLLKNLGDNLGKHPLLILNHYSDKEQDELNKKIVFPPPQQPLIPQMDQFNICQPEKEPPMYIVSGKKDLKYIHYFGNVDLDELDNGGD